MADFTRIFSALTEEEEEYRKLYEENGDSFTHIRLPIEVQEKAGKGKRVRLLSSYFLHDSGSSVAILKHPCFMPPYIHCHDFLECTYVIKGNAQETIEGESISLEEGSAVIITPGHYHTISVFDSTTIAINLIISKSILPHLPGLLAQTCRNDIFSVLSDDKERLVPILERLYDECIYNEKSEEMIILILSELSVEAMRSCRVIQSEKLDKEKSEAFRYLTYIDTEFRTITLTSFAEHFGFTEQYASNLIKAKLGESFMNIVKARKMQEAIRLLTETHKSCKEIAYEVGYSSQEHFTRTFSQYFGISPMKMREASRMMP